MVMNTLCSEGYIIMIVATQFRVAPHTPMMAMRVNARNRQGKQRTQQSEWGNPIYGHVVAKSPPKGKRVRVHCEHQLSVGEGSARANIFGHCANVGVPAKASHNDKYVRVYLVYPVIRSGQCSQPVCIDIG